MNEYDHAKVLVLMEKMSNLEINLQKYILNFNVYQDQFNKVHNEQAELLQKVIEHQKILAKMENLFIDKQSDQLQFNFQTAFKSSLIESIIKELSIQSKFATLDIKLKEQQKQYDKQFNYLQEQIQQNTQLQSKSSEQNQQYYDKDVDLTNLIYDNLKFKQAMENVQLTTKQLKFDMDANTIKLTEIQDEMKFKIDEKQLELSHEKIINEQIEFQSQQLQFQQQFAQSQKIQNCNIMAQLSNDLQQSCQTIRQEFWNYQDRLDQTIQKIQTQENITDKKLDEIIESYDQINQRVDNKISEVIQEQVQNQINQIKNSLENYQDQMSKKFQDFDLKINFINNYQQTISKQGDYNNSSNYNNTYTQGQSVKTLQQTIFNNAALGLQQPLDNKNKELIDKANQKISEVISSLKVFKEETKNQIEELLEKTFNLPSNKQVQQNTVQILSAETDIRQLKKKMDDVKAFTFQLDDAILDRVSKLDIGNFKFQCMRDFIQLKDFKQLTDDFQQIKKQVEQIKESTQDKIQQLQNSLQFTVDSQQDKKVKEMYPWIQELLQQRKQILDIQNLMTQKAGNNDLIKVNQNKANKQLVNTLLKYFGILKKQFVYLTIIFNQYIKDNNPGAENEEKSNQISIIQKQISSLLDWVSTIEIIKDNKTQTNQQKIQEQKHPKYNQLLYNENFPTQKEQNIINLKNNLLDNSFTTQNKAVDEVLQRFKTFKKAIIALPQHQFNSEDNQKIDFALRYSPIATNKNDKTLIQLDDEKQIIDAENGKDNKIILINKEEQNKNQIEQELIQDDLEYQSLTEDFYNLQQKKLQDKKSKKIFNLTIDDMYSQSKQYDQQKLHVQSAKHRDKQRQKSNKIIFTKNSCNEVVVNNGKDYLKELNKKQQQSQLKINMHQILDQNPFYFNKQRKFRVTNIASQTCRSNINDKLVLPNKLSYTIDIQQSQIDKTDASLSDSRYEQQNYKDKFISDQSQNNTFSNQIQANQNYNIKIEKSQKNYRSMSQPINQINNQQ